MIMKRSHSNHIDVKTPINNLVNYFTDIMNDNNMRMMEIWILSLDSAGTFSIGSQQ